MKQAVLRHLVFLGSIVSSGHAVASAYEIGDLVGIWQLFDQKHNNKTMQIEISYDAYTNSYYGNIAKLEKASKLKASSLCVKCPRPQRGKKMKGLQLVWGLKPQVKKSGRFTGKYNKGKLLDPVTGKVQELTIVVSRTKNIIRAATTNTVSHISEKETWMRVK